MQKLEQITQHMKIQEILLGQAVEVVEFQKSSSDILE